MSDSKLLVLKKDGTSYLQRWPWTDLLVNGQTPAICPGNADWLMVEGDVETVLRVLPPLRERSGFRLKPEFAGVVSLDEERPAYAFDWDDDEDEWTGEHAELYEAVYREVARDPEPVEFEVIDHDCEPVQMPSYIKVEFPANLKYHRAVQHKYPCSIAMPAVFSLVADAIVAETQKHKGLYSLHDCRNIGVLGVDAVIDIVPRQEKRDVGFSRPRWKTVTVASITKRVLSIVGEYRDKSHAEQIVGLEAENYAALDAKLQAYIKSFTDRIDPRRWRVCPHCNGEGLVLAEAAR